MEGGIRNGVRVVWGGVCRGWYRGGVEGGVGAGGGL